jgi:eukaryotic-like serine/threonine-protein kinase
MQPSAERIAFERRKRAIFEAVRDLPADQQARALVALTGGDLKLEDAVRKLLASSLPESDGVLNRPLYDRTRNTREIPKMIGRYPVERLVGTGGMGEIYACRDPKSGFSVAVKIIRSDIASQAACEHFKRERDILMRMDHPNVCKMIDANVADQGIPFIVMQFVEGQPLDRFCRERRCSTEEKLLLLSQVLAGVDYLHAQNVVHRDLKPSNLSVTPQRSVRILDFGIAKMIEHEKGRTGHEKTATKVPGMTLRYASPEQLSGTLSGRASDIYALGVIGYELLSGRRPLPPDCETNPQLLLQALRTHTLLPPSRYASGLTDSMDNLILNALHVDPESRYRSVGLFLSDLRRCLEGGTVPRRYVAQPSRANA